MLIREAETRINEGLEERLAQHDAKIDAIGNDVAILVGTSKLTGLVQQTKLAVDKLTDNSNIWDQDDLAFRSQMVEKILTVEGNTMKLMEQVSDISWFVVVNRGLIWISD